MVPFGNMRKPHIENPAVLELAKQILLGLLGWSRDEVRLTKLDARALLHRYLFGLGLLFASFAILTAAIFTMVQTLIGALADYVHGNLVAGLIVSLGLFGITALMIAVAHSSITKKPVAQGVVFRHLLGRDKGQ